MDLLTKMQIHSKKQSIKCRENYSARFTFDHTKISFAIMGIKLSLSGIFLVLSFIFRNTLNLKRQVS